MKSEREKFKYEQSALEKQRNPEISFRSLAEKYRLSNESHAGDDSAHVAQDRKRERVQRAESPCHTHDVYATGVRC